MVPRSFKDRAFVLARKNYQEADRIITVFGQHYGKLSLLAKGVRKIKSRKKGHLEVFSHITYSASHTKGFDILTEVEEIESFKEVRKDLKKVAVAFFYLEAVAKVSRDGEGNQKIYNLLDDSLKGLSNSKNLKKDRNEFTRKLLVALGFWPEGKKLEKPDNMLSEITESKLGTVRIGKNLLS